jgi:hypothetical protein
MSALSMKWRFIREDTIGSEIIQFYEGRICAPSHVDAVLADGYLGARLDGGVQLRPFDYIKPAWALTVQLDATPSQDAKFEESLRSKIGVPYDFAGVLSFVLPTEISNPQAQFCSELQTWALCESGRIPAKLAKPAAEIDPLEFLLLLSAMTPIFGRNA